MKIDIGEMYLTQTKTGYKLNAHELNIYVNIKIESGSVCGNLLLEVWRSTVSSKTVVVTYSDGWRRIQYAGYVIFVDACDILRNMHKWRGK